MLKKLSIAVISLSLSLTGLALAPANAVLESPTAIGDVNTLPDSSFPENLTPFDDKLYFSMIDPTYGEVLASWDLATSTKTIFTPSQTGGSSPRDLYVFEDVLYFYADTPTGTALFKYTGEGNPTMLLNAEFEMRFSPADSPIFGWDGHGLYFYMMFTENEYRLYKYDGTNTPALVDFPGYNSGFTVSVRRFALVGDWLYFAACNGNVYSTALARTDGTTAEYAQTNLLAYQNYGLASFTAFKNHLYFSTNSGGEVGELLKYDQATDQIAAISNFDSYVSASRASSFYIFGASGNERLYFTAFSPTFGTQLWRTNSNESGIEQVTDFEFGFFGVSYNQLNSKLYFIAQTQDYPVRPKLFSYSGTGAFDPTPISENLGWGTANIAVIGSNLYFHAVDLDEDGELYSSDGIHAAVLAADLNSSNRGSVQDSDSGNPTTAVFKNNFYYVSSAANGGQAVQKYSGTGLQTPLNISGDSFIYINGLVASEFYLFVDVYNQTTGEDEIWRYSGTSAPVRITTEISSGIQLLGNRLIGHSEGQLYEISPVNGSLTAIGIDFEESWDLTIFNNSLYFIADTSDSSRLYKWDGSGDPELAISDVVGTGDETYISDLTAMGNRLFFTARYEETIEVMSIDTSGNLMGHFTVESIHQAYQGQIGVGTFVAFNNSLYFDVQVYGPNYAYGGMWKFDGTNLPTKLDFNDNAAWRMFNPAVINNKLTFITSAEDALNDALWTLDTAGVLTKRVELFGTQRTPWVSSLGTKLLFGYNDGIHGLELASLPLPSVVVKTKPGKISKLVVVKKQIKKTSAQLTWKAPAVTGGASITNYKVETSTDGKKWKVFKHSVSKKVNIVIKGLKSKKKYWVRVSAINSVGTGISVKVNFKTK